MAEKTTINNNSGIRELYFRGSLYGKRIKTNLGNEGVVVREWLCYPEPSEWVLDNGYNLNEFYMHITQEFIIEVEVHEGEVLITNIKEGLDFIRNSSSMIRLTKNSISVHSDSPEFTKEFFENNKVKLVSSEDISASRKDYEETTSEFWKYLYDLNQNHDLLLIFETNQREYKVVGFKNIVK